MPVAGAETLAALAVGATATAWIPGLGQWVMTLGVSMLGAHRGYGWGLAAGVGAGALTMMQAGESPLAVLALTQPASTLPAAIGLALLGAGVGQLGDAQRQRLTRQAEELEQLAAYTRRVQARHDALATDKEAIEIRLTREVLPLHALRREVQALAGLAPPALMAGALALLERFLEVEAAAIYLQGADGLELAAAIGDRPDRPKRLDEDATLACRSKAGRPAISGRDALPAAILMAAPLLDEGGIWNGVLVVERLPFVQLHEASAAALALVAGLLASELSTVIEPTARRPTWSEMRQ